MGQLMVSSHRSQHCLSPDTKALPGKSNTDKKKGWLNYCFFGLWYGHNWGIHSQNEVNLKVSWVRREENKWLRYRRMFYKHLGKINKKNKICPELVRLTQEVVVIKVDRKEEWDVNESVPCQHFCGCVPSLSSDYTNNFKWIKQVLNILSHNNCIYLK